MATTCEFAVEYLEGKITGSQALDLFNEEVRIGRRKGKIRESILPYTRQEGLRLTRLENARKARAAYAVNVSQAKQEQVRKTTPRGNLATSA